MSKIPLLGEMHWRQLAALGKPRFTYSACRPFTNKERTQNFKEEGHSRFIYQNEPDKVYFQHNMAYTDFKDLPRGTASDAVLCIEAFDFAKSPKYDRYQRGLASVVYKFFNKNVLHTKEQDLILI